MIWRDRTCTQCRNSNNPEKWVYGTGLCYNCTVANKVKNPPTEKVEDKQYNRYSVTWEIFKEGVGTTKTVIMKVEHTDKITDWEAIYLYLQDRYDGLVSTFECSFIDEEMTLEFVEGVI